MTDYRMLRVGGHRHSCREELIRPTIFAQGCIDLDRQGVPLPVDVWQEAFLRRSHSFGDPVASCIHLARGRTRRSFAPRLGADQSCIRGPEDHRSPSPWWGPARPEHHLCSCAHFSDARE